MQIKQILIVRQEDTESKIDYLNALESLESQGFTVLTSDCYDKDKQLAQSVLQKDMISLHSDTSSIEDSIAVQLN